MDRARRHVWRVSGSTLILLGLLTAVCLLGLPTLAWFSWQARPSLWVPGLLGLLALLGLLYAWRFGWHPRVVATETRLVVKNPFRTTRFGWQDVSLVLPGGNGLLVAGPDHRAEAWCVQKSDRDHRSGRPSRADRIGDEIWALWLLHHPPVEVRGQYVITRARPGIEAGLAELERRASSEALSHIFPGERFPFPIETVTERWHDVLRDPTKQTFVALSEEPAPDPDPGDDAGSDSHRHRIRRPGRLGHGTRPPADRLRRPQQHRGAASGGRPVAAAAGLRHHAAAPRRGRDLHRPGGHRGQPVGTGAQPPGTGLLSRPRLARHRQPPTLALPAEATRATDDQGEPPGRPPHPGRTQLSPDPSPTARRFQPLWVGLGLLALFPSLYAIILRVVPPNEDDAALLASFIAYGNLFGALSLTCFVIALARARHRLLLGGVTVLTAACLTWSLSWQLPLFVPDGRTMTTDPITVLSLNIRVGGAEEAQLAQQAATADIVVLVEVTPGALQVLRDGPMGRRFPYVVPQTDLVDNGSAIFSRFPLSEPRTLPRTSWVMRSTVADVPRLGRLTVVGAHPCNPLCGMDKWVDDHAVLRQYLATLGSGPVLVAGDFNAVDDHAPMRALDADGFESAADIAGAGWLPTYPADRGFPPLLPIDHILLNDRLTASSVSAFTVAGTDHRGLRAEIGGTR